MKAEKHLEKWELFCKGSRDYSRSQAKYKTNISHSDKKKKKGKHFIDIYENNQNLKMTCWFVEHC